MSDMHALTLALPASFKILFALLLLSLSCQGLAQSDEEKTRQQLQQLDVEIKRIEAEISDASQRQTVLQTQLKKTEVALGVLKRDIANNQQAFADSAKKLADLKEQRREHEKARDEQQAHIAAELKTAWQVGRQGQVKVLLSQQNPHTVARSLGYYRYFFRARNTMIEEYRENLRQLVSLQQRIDTTATELGLRGQTLQEQQVELTAAQTSRTLAMTQLDQSIRSNSAQLQHKEQDRQQLEDLLQTIEEAIVDLEVPTNYEPFNSAKGNMDWPIEGKQSNQFGRSRNAGKMQWQGITIAAEEGTTVKAIHHGRVVYADWLRGSGLLLIIDHGDGYMSLYAHNESLLREVGEWVTAGSPISTVGNSGGMEQTAVYFEVRHNGKPTNPANWCKS